MTQQEISSIIEQYDLSALECDGATRVIHTILTEYKIDHACFVGVVLYEEKSFVHFWITCHGFIVDYKIRMWMGDLEIIKEGVFKDEETVVTYKGDETSIPVLSNTVFNVLTSKKDASL